MNGILQLDYQAFKVVNTDWSNSILDSVLPILTDLHKVPAFWAFAVLVFTLWIWKHRRRALVGIIGVLLAVVVSETVSYRLLKNYVARPRPEFTQGLEVKLRTHSHSGDSFPSLHASNNFAGATFLSLMYPPASPIFYAAAILIAFSRVYVGVHFPADVLGGALIGILCGLFVWFVMKRLKVSQVHLT
jgi:undecaprenyl-diphosphatase